ncbi:MAG: Hsp20/alpha crystallin family protein [Candidatus Eisenbacteria bacterium]
MENQKGEMTMTMLRWKPAVIRNEFGMERFVDGFFNNSGWNESDGTDVAWRPRTDVREETDAYTIHVDLPGVKKDDIRIVVEESILKISGERKHASEESSEGYRRIERSFGSFERTFRLPKEVEIDKIESTYEAGVLAVRVPKSEKALPRQIEVKVR